jgi:hypothetical protein
MRTKLVDEPIVEMLLSNKYSKANMTFVKSADTNEYSYYANGVMRNLVIRRNSSKYYNSANFSISINKDDISVYNNSLFVFIDEIANCLYTVNGEDLLKYILQKKDNLKASSANPDSYYLLIPKKDILELVSDNDNHVIKYNESVANLFALCRDESFYDYLT